LKNLKELREICRSQGLRLTHQRLEVFRELLSTPGHPSAEDVCQRVRRRLPSISLDTVYRTIYTFERCGVVKRLSALDERIRFDSNLEPHHHLVCVRCRQIEDFYWPDFAAMEKPEEVEMWGEIHTEHVELRGLCKNCRTDPVSPAGKPRRKDPLIS